jgi:Fe-S cluster assembly scaffold protein SufB
VSDAPSRSRPARRPLDDLGIRVSSQIIDRLAEDDPEWLTEDRRAALDAYERLPGESSQLYTPYIDLRAADLGDVDLATPEFPSHLDGELGTDIDAIVSNDEGRHVYIAISEEARAAGVSVLALPDGLDPVPADLIGGGALPGSDRFAQLTRLAWTQGVLIDVPDGVRLQKPVVVRYAVGAAAGSLVTRTLVRLGDGADAAVVEELVASHEAETATSQAFFAGTTEVTLGVGSNLRFASLQELPPNVVAIQHRVSRIGEGAQLHWALAQLGGRLVRSRIDNRLEGDRSSVEQVEIVFGANEQLFDLTSYTTHVGRDTTGNLLSKGALLEKARTYMKGLITIEKSAIGTDSFLGEFGMNLSKDARSVAIPSLEIDQPDCRRAAHSSSVGPIDEAQLFYLESRGIPPDEARKFIVLGFLEPVVARVPLGEAQDRLRDLLEAKWAAGMDGVLTGATAA